MQTRGEEIIAARDMLKEELKVWSLFDGGAKIQMLSIEFRCAGASHRMRATRTSSSNPIRKWTPTQAATLLVPDASALAEDFKEEEAENCLHPQCASMHPLGMDNFCW